MAVVLARILPNCHLLSYCSGMSVCKYGRKAHSMCTNFVKRQYQSTNTPQIWVNKITIERCLDDAVYWLGYELDKTEIEVRIPTEAKKKGSLFQRVQTGAEAYPVFCAMGSWCALSGGSSSRVVKMITDRYLVFRLRINGDMLWARNPFGGILTTGKSHGKKTCIFIPIKNWTHVYMNLFTRNIPYCHLLKYLLFLLKHPVYVWFYIYIYIYI